MAFSHEVLAQHWKTKVRLSCRHMALLHFKKLRQKCVLFGSLTSKNMIYNRSIPVQLPKLSQLPHPNEDKTTFFVGLDPFCASVGLEFA